jgi:hypothetical protein
MRHKAKAASPAEAASHRCNARKGGVSRTGHQTSGWDELEAPALTT